MFTRVVFSKSKSAHGDPNGGNQSCSYGQRWFRLSKLFSVNNKFWDSRTITIPTQTFKKLIFFGNSCTNGNISIDTFMQEIRPIFTDKMSLSFLINQYIKHFLECSEYQDSYTGNRIDSCNDYLFATKWSCSTAPMMEKVKLVVTEIYEIEKCDKSVIIPLFGKIGLPRILCYAQLVWKVQPNLPLETFMKQIRSVVTENVYSVVDIKQH